MPQAPWEEILDSLTNRLGFEFRQLPKNNAHGVYVIGERISAVAVPHYEMSYWTQEQDKAPEWVVEHYRRAELSSEPLLEVVLDYDVHLTTRVVTVGQWRAVMGSLPGGFVEEEGGDHLPITRVNWNDALSFCRRLNEVERLIHSDFKISLPIEPEWEIACRAGTETRFWTGEANESLKDSALVRGHKNVASPANPWGFFDMHGNVWEWCLDPWPWNQSLNPIYSSIRPRARVWEWRQWVESTIAEEEFRSFRGGSAFVSADRCRSATRDGTRPTRAADLMGFRICLVPTVRPGAEAPHVLSANVVTGIPRDPEKRYERLPPRGWHTS